MSLSPNLMLSWDMVKPQLRTGIIHFSEISFMIRYINFISAYSELKAPLDYSLEFILKAFMSSLRSV